MMDTTDIMDTTLIGTGNNGLAVIVGLAKAAIADWEAVAIIVDTTMRIAFQLGKRWRCTVMEESLSECCWRALLCEVVEN